MLSQFTNTLIELLKRISDVLPLPWFTFLGSFIEEIIAPIPSPLVMTLAGSIAATQSHKWAFLGLLAMVGAVGKTIASYILYYLADKGEDIVLTKFGKFLGVTHKQVESIGSRMNKGWKDDLFLLLLRAAPIVPSAPISIICGLIKLNLRTYITSTLAGTFIRNIFYLVVGYMGVNATEAIILKLENFEIFGYVVVVLLLAAIIGYVYFQK